MLAESEGQLAIWHVSPGGERTGAWSMPVVDSRREAWRLLRLIEHRAIAGLRHDDDLDVLRRLADQAGVPVPSTCSDHWVDVCTLSFEIAEVRARLRDAVANHQRTSKSRLAALAFEHEAETEPLPRDVPAALSRASLALPVADTNDSIKAALGAAMLVAAAARSWQDTELVRLRRPYLVISGGPAQRVLPPRWLSHLRSTADMTFSL
jgi:hypothetical protein